VPLLFPDADVVVVALPLVAGVDATLGDDKADCCAATWDKFPERGEETPVTIPCLRGLDVRKVDGTFVVEVVASVRTE